MANEKARKKLTVLSAGTAKDLKLGDRDARVIQFKAKDEAGNELVYEAWDREQTDQVVVGVILDADIYTGEKDGQPVYKVVQMYDAEGKPIRPTKGGGAKGGKGGYGSYGKSPADLAMERRSFEGQTAFIHVMDLAKTMPIEGEFKTSFDKALKWANVHLDDTMKPWPMPQFTAAPAKVEPATTKSQPPTTKVEPPITKPETKETKVEPKVTKAETKEEEKPPVCPPHWWDEGKCRICGATEKASTEEKQAELKKETVAKTSITDDTRHKLAAVVSEKNYDPDIVQARIQRLYMVANSHALTEEQGLDLLAQLEKGDATLVKKGAS